MRPSDETMLCERVGGHYHSYPVVEEVSGSRPLGPGQRQLRRRLLPAGGGSSHNSPPHSSSGWHSRRCRTCRAFFFTAPALPPRLSAGRWTQNTLPVVPRSVLRSGSCRSSRRWMSASSGVAVAGSCLPGPGGAGLHKGGDVQVGRPETGPTGRCSGASSTATRGDVRLPQ